MDSFTRDGAHLGRHLEYPDSNSMHLPLPKSAKNLLGGYFSQGSPQNQGSATGLIFGHSLYGLVGSLRSVHMHPVLYTSTVS